MQPVFPTHKLLILILKTAKQFIIKTTSEIKTTFDKSTTWSYLQGSALHGLICKVLHCMVLSARFYIAWSYLQGSALHSLIYKVLHYMVLFTKFWITRSYLQGSALHSLMLCLQGSALHSLTVCLQGSTLHSCACKVLHYTVVFARFYITR